MKGSLTLSKKDLAKLSQEEREKANQMGARKSEPGEPQPSKREQKRLRKEAAKKAAVEERRAASGEVDQQAQAAVPDTATVTA